MLDYRQERVVDVTDCVSASKRLIASESMSELHFAKRARGGVAWDVDSPHVTPPGTPPPPYPAPTSEDQADNNSSRGEVSVVPHVTSSFKSLSKLQPS